MTDTPENLRLKQQTLLNSQVSSNTVQYSGPWSQYYFSKQDNNAKNTKLMQKVRKESEHFSVHLVSRTDAAHFFYNHKSLGSQAC